MRVLVVSEDFIARHTLSSYENNDLHISTLYEYVQTFFFRSGTIFDAIIFDVDLKILPVHDHLTFCKYMCPSANIIFISSTPNEPKLFDFDPHPMYATPTNHSEAKAILDVLQTRKMVNPERSCSRVRGILQAC